MNNQLRKEIEELKLRCIPTQDKGAKIVKLLSEFAETRKHFDSLPFERQRQVIRDYSREALEESLKCQ